MKTPLRYRLMHRMNVPCGDFGGEVYDRDEVMRRQNAGEPTERWCWNRFGHEDSCRYEWSTQPLRQMRQRYKGWTECPADNIREDL